MSVQPDADELEVRARLQGLGVSYAPVPSAAPRREPGEGDLLEEAAPTGEEAAPLEGLRAWAEDDEPAAAVPAPRPGSPRLPDWWAKDRPHLAVVPDPQDQEQPDAPAADEDQDDEEPGEEATSSRPRRARARTWVDNVLARTGGGTSEDPEDTGDQEDDEDDEEEPGEEDTGDTSGDTPAPAAPAKGGPTPGGPVSETTGALRWRSRPRKAPRPRHRPRFAAAGIPHTMKPAKERKSLLEIIRSTPDHVRWMVYNGSALGAGFYLGWPQWAKDGTAYLAAEHPTLTDTYSLTCYALAAGVLFLDYRARAWLPPVPWLFRIPTVSLAVGIPLHGVSTPISQLF